MSFDNLVWIILIILAYVISTVLKNARAGSPSQKNDGDKKRPGWKEKLDMYLARVRQELESAKAGDSKEETGWDLKISPDLKDTPIPTEEELAIVRDTSAPLLARHRRTDIETR